MQNIKILPVELNIYWAMLLIGGIWSLFHLIFLCDKWGRLCWKAKA